MRVTNTKINAFGGYDYTYSIRCDICGGFLTNNVKKHKDFGKPAEFMSCGEEWMQALTEGWIGDHETIICKDCLKSIGR
jgi:hypothetical protein